MKTYAKYLLLAMLVCVPTWIEPAAGQTASAPTASRPERWRQRRLFPVRWVRVPDSLPDGVRHETFHSKAMNCDVGYCIATPPGYADGQTRYPVLYLLHGLGGNELTYRKHLERLHEAMANGQIPPLIAVAVNGGSATMYCDSVDGTILPDTMIIRELIPHIDSQYRTISSRQGRIIEGFSMGGFGALKFAFKYPELFCAVVGGAPALLEWDRVTSERHAEMASRMYANDREAFESEHPRTWLKKNADKIRGKLRIRIMIGDQDGLKAYNDAFRKLMDELEIPYEYEVVEGVGHSSGRVYAKLGTDGLRFHAAVLEHAREVNQK